MLLNAQYLILKKINVTISKEICVSLTAKAKEVWMNAPRGTDMPVA